MSGNLNDIRSLSEDEISAFLTSKGEKKFRAGQVYDWLWKRSCSSFDEMTNLPIATRKLLQQNFSFSHLSISEIKKSSDGTQKLLFRLEDGLAIEGVLIPSAGRTTACISSQVGCALGCTFCATGSLGFSRNLNSWEIVDQVMILNDLSLKDHGIQLSNIVYMGMGEPLMNLPEVSRSIEMITSPDSLGMSPQRITVSTVGLPKMIRELATQKIRYHFALSLHAANDFKRDQIIPLNRRYPLKEISDALVFFHKETKKRITIEYILFRNFNDSVADARELAEFCRSFPVKVNLIEYNAVNQTGFKKPDPLRTKAFMEFLESRNMVVNLRKSRGEDIDAACGQLAGRLKNPDQKKQS